MQSEYLNISRIGWEMGELATLQELFETERK